MIKNWNGPNAFIFFGKGGELAPIDTEQEVGMLALHLLQVSLVYINTLMIQRVLADPSWGAGTTPEDLRPLTPLIYGRVNPYGTYHLDMEPDSP